MTITKFATTLGAVFITALLVSAAVSAQDLNLANAKSWTVSGRVQLQHEVDTKAEDNEIKTTNGFRIRRGRFQVKAKLTKFISTKFQIEVRDNSPKLKDAEGKMKFGGNTYMRFGQFKVPVWREELRSSSKLMLVERSEAAEFLVDWNLSSRQIGVEFGGEIADKVEFAVNYSNGAGAAGREDAGEEKVNSVNKFEFINNGKLITGRITYPVSKNIEFGVSAALNNLGTKIGNNDATGTVSVVTPDVGLELDLSENSDLTIEGNVAFGSIDKVFSSNNEAVSFRLYDVTGQWLTKFAEASENLAGMDKIGFAAGIYNIEPNTDVEKDEEVGIRFGPIFYFGKKSRLQVNGEITNYAADDAESDFKVRSQLTFNF
ncbi:MAG: hypothetical protein DWQ05_21540 [Calditrichaeota bacterium]|nr:MAG: hypothetical protein DWQ05_21540 [Calditrichota bacterium]